MSTPSSVRCLREETIQRFLDAQLSRAEDEAARHHLDRCPECRGLVADLVRQGSVEIRSVASRGLALPTDAMTVRKGDLVANTYVVGELLGHGGMGYVVSARHERLGSTVAIKFLRSELATDQSSVGRFVREAQVGASIRSNHCVRVHDVGSMPSGAPFIVMEQLEGRPLSTVLSREQPLSPERVVRWTLQACDAVAEAHELGVIHRDLKLQNIFLAEMGSDREPMIKVLDFGLAKHLRAAGLTLPEELLGTPHYMAPEQIRDPRSVGAPADIWALGACLYRLLTGEHPFPGLQRTEICASILKDEPPTVRELRPEVSDELAAVVHRCLEKHPERRPISVRELQRGLAALL